MKFELCSIYDRPNMTVEADRFEVRHDAMVFLRNERVEACFDTQVWHLVEDKKPMVPAHASKFIHDVSTLFGIQSNATNKIVVTADANEGIVTIETKTFMREEQSGEFVAVLRQYMLMERS